MLKTWHGLLPLKTHSQCSTSSCDKHDNANPMQQSHDRNSVMIFSEISHAIQLCEQVISVINL